MEKVNNNLMILETEKEQTKLRLKEQIRSIRYSLDNLESKLDNGEHLYDSDGLQGNGAQIDTYLVKLVAYERAIQLFNRSLNKGN